MIHYKLKLITIAILLIKINPENITFKIQIENNKLKENETDHSNFQTEIIKSFEVKINENQLPKGNKENRIKVKDIINLITKDENFKNVDVTEKNILFKIYGYYFINEDISKEKLINKGTANIYFRDKHNYHICYGRYNIKDKIEVTHRGITQEYDKEDIETEFEDLNEDWFEDNNCCFLTKREIQGVILRNSFLGNISIIVHKNKIFINNLDLFFKKEPVRVTEIFQFPDFYKEFVYEYMTYYNVKTLHDLVYKILLDIKYEDLYSIEYTDKNGIKNNTFKFNNETGQMKKKEDIDKELKKIYVDKNDYFKIKRREDSPIYKYIRLEKKIKDLKKIINSENSKLKNNHNVGLCYKCCLSCKCCSSCLN